MPARRSDDQPRDARDGDSTRYGERSGSGANEPPRSERKETRGDWRSRQGPNADRGGRDSGEAGQQQ